jgi:hypothetical protein
MHPRQSSTRYHPVSGKIAMFEWASSMRDSRVVPERLRPTIKMGESVDRVMPFDCVVSASDSDIKRSSMSRVFLTKSNLRPHLDWHLSTYRENAVEVAMR